MIDYIFEQFSSEIAGEWRAKSEKMRDIFCVCMFSFFFLSFSHLSGDELLMSLLIYFCIYVEIEFSGKSSIHQVIVCFFCRRHNNVELGNEKKKSWSRICAQVAKRFCSMWNFDKGGGSLRIIHSLGKQKKMRLSLEPIGSVINLQRFNINNGCRYSCLISGQYEIFVLLVPFKPAVTSYWIPTIVFRHHRFCCRSRCCFFAFIVIRNIFRSFVHPSSQKERTKNNNNLTKHML